jgi:alpha-beta hydrolase superfamily lysophospholipase
LVHGYYDHAGTWKNLLSHLLSSHYTVAILELPGHGLSSGDRVSIHCFSEYRKAVYDFMSLCQKNLKGPFHIVAHSLGAGIMADCILSHEASAIDGKVVLLAPLIQAAHARISRIGVAMASPFFSSLPRLFRNNSSNEPFLRFVRKDPLQERYLSLAFCRAMYAWHKTMSDRAPSEKKTLIIQGTGDTTVDWRFNLRFLSTKFPNAEFTLIPDAGHQLANESAPLRSKVFGLIDTWIQESPLEPIREKEIELSHPTQSIQYDKSSISSSQS